MKIVKHGYGDTIKTDRGYFKQTSESEVPSFPQKYGEPDEQVSWKNNYVVLAENRPLMALFEMRRQKFLDETEYQLQFRLFYQVNAGCPKKTLLSEVISFSLRSVFWDTL